MGLNFLLPIVAFLGMVSGIITGRLAKEEFNENRRYVLFISRIILSILIVFLSYKSGSILSFLIGLVAGFFLTATYLYLGLAVASTLASPFSFVVSTLVFLYGIPYGTLSFNTLNWRIIFLHMIFFLAPFSILMIWPSYSNVLVSLSSGLLIGCLENNFTRRH